MIKYGAFLFFGIIFLFSFQNCNEEKQAVKDDQVEVVMRRIGHEVLLSSNDSLSLVKPILYPLNNL